MSDEQPVNPEEMDALQPAAAVPVDVEAILEDYRRRQMIEHLTGPLVSVILHLVLIVLGFVFVVSKVEKPTTDVEVNLENMVVKPPSEQVDQKLKELEQKIDDSVVPPVEKPTLTDTDSTEAVGSGGEGGGNTGGVGSSDALDAGSLSDVRANVSPLKLAALGGGGAYAGRLGTKIGSGTGGGGSGTGATRAAETSVLRALRWLKENQNPDGSWSNQYPCAMTGLALLAYLAHGETPELSKEFGETVLKAIQYLTTKMNAAPGILEKEYSHGIATYALSEAYGMTRNPMIKPAMEKGLATIIKGQQTGGGWNYNYAPLKGGPHDWDTSVAGWQIQAMKAGLIGDADVPGLVEALEKSLGFLQKSAFKKTGFAYSNETGATKSMSAAGLLCLQLMGMGKSEEAQKAMEFISDVKVEWNSPARKEVAGHSNPCYAWYYQTQAMFYAGKSSWDAWNKMFAPELIGAQKPDGHWDCPPPAPGGKYEVPQYDKYYSTTLCCLMLEVYYRFLPTFKVDLKGHDTEKSVLDLDSGA